MNNYNYKIIGKCPFGTCQLNKDGMMKDPSQFGSEKESDYRDGDNANILIDTAEMYGANPICKIQIKYGEILCYAVGHRMMTFKFKSPNGWTITSPYPYINTVNPIAIVKYFIERIEGIKSDLGVFDGHLKESNNED